MFLGGPGAGYVFVSPQGGALLDIVAQPPRIRPFARDFTGFLIAQANAYDADRRFLGKAADLAGYQACSHHLRSPARHGRGRGDGDLRGAADRMTVSICLEPGYRLYSYGPAAKP